MEKYPASTCQGIIALFAELCQNYKYFSANNEGTQNQSWIHSQQTQENWQDHRRIFKSNEKNVRGQSQYNNERHKQNEIIELNTERSKPIRHAETQGSNC